MKTGDHEQTWAEALVSQLVADKAIELRAAQSPVKDIAKILPDAAKVPDDDNADAWEELGGELLDALVDSTAVDEVFVDEAELVAVARKTLPS